VHPFFIGGNMGKEKKGSSKTKIRNTASNRIMKIKREIRKYEKKLKKLLARFEEGKSRWKWKGKKKELIEKRQGIVPGSKRHERLEAHIESLRELV
jgi:hypothetical protein